MQGLRKVQAQLDVQAVTLERLEQNSQKIYISLDSGMREIRRDLQSNSKDLEDLKILRTYWKVVVDSIENLMERKETSDIDASFDDLKNYFESYAINMEKSLRDLIIKEFDDMKGKVLEGASEFSPS